MEPNLQLKRERQKRGWSQAKVAEELGIDMQTVSRWERGIHQPYPYFVEKLCALFGKEAEALGLLEEQEIQDTSPPPSVIEPQMSQHLATTPTSQLKKFIDPATPLLQTRLEKLVGRDALLERLKTYFLTSNNSGRLLVLRGLPGVGKTTLATVLAHDRDLDERFPDGILWANLGPTPNLLQHFSRWAACLDVVPDQPVHTPTQWAQYLHTHLRERACLFVLDDAWEVESVLALMLGGPHSAHLVTTRVPRVSYYFAPEEVQIISELSPQESLTLLQQFVPSLTPAQQESVDALIQTVGGLPLALNLIGRFLRARAVTGQPRRLDSALKQMNDAASRLQVSVPCTLIDQRAQSTNQASISLDSIIALSEQQIAPSLRLVLGRLALFPPKPASVGEALALRVCQTEPMVLDELYDAGLLDSPEPQRYYLHQTISDYVRLHLPASHESRTHFVEELVGFVEAHASDYDLLEQESSSILAGLHMAEHEGLVMLYLRGVLAFRTFLSVRYWSDLGLRLFTRAVELVRQSGDHAGEITCLLHAGQFAQEMRQLEQAEALLQQGLQLARAHNETRMLNHFLLASAELLEQRGNYTQAHHYLREGVALAAHLNYSERSSYHGGTANYTNEALCVHLTELQSLLHQGYIAPIDDLLTSWPDAQAFSPAVLDLMRGSDGRLYGIPVDIYVQCLAYNRRLFREAGLDPETPPTTWQEFFTAARQTARPDQGIAGFALETIQRQGGWNFTNWLYSGGGRVMEVRDGHWLARFADERAADFLKQIQRLHFDDHALPQRLFLSANDTVSLFGAGQVAMVVTSPASIMEFNRTHGVELADIGLAAMPQQGGNACLLGGTAYVFSARSSPQARQRAFAEVMRAHFDPQVYEERMRRAVAAGQGVGLTNIPLLTGHLQQRLNDIVARYANVPLHNYRWYMQSTLTPLPEPPIAAQEFYCLIDPILQTILRDPRANPRVLLEEAARTFQRHFLRSSTPATDVAQRHISSLGLNELVAKQS